MKKNNKKGFTLAELLVVVAIIGVLTAIAIPVFSASTKKARDASVEANLRSTFAEATVKFMEESATLDAKEIDDLTYTTTVSGDDVSVSVTVTAGKGGDLYDGKTVTYDGKSFNAAA